MGRLEGLLGQLDASPQARGHEFELLCKWFLENDPVYASQIKDVVLWNDWDDRWGPDTGIDLVATSKSGGLWAIQAKAYGPDQTVTKAAIDSFLSESSREGFTFRLLIATTDRLSTNAKRTLAGQKVPARALLRTDLFNSEAPWPARLGGKPARRKRITPDDHQKDARSDVVRGFKTSERGQLIMACGTGKTLTSLFIAEELKANRVLVLVPSLSLLKQTIPAWTLNAKRPVEFLPVCSDETVSRANAGLESDAAVMSTFDLGFPVTRDPQEIATFLRKRGDNLRVVFSTYQSSGRIEEAQKLGRVPKFDLVIADEAHRCTGNVSSDFATVLDASKIRADRRLFMTATPRILSSRVQRAALDEGLEFASMDDEDAFGPVFHRLTFATAIEQNLLADYQVVILGVDNEEILRAIQEREFVTTDGKDIISADRLGAAVGLAKAIRTYGLTRVITFHGRVKAASNFASTFPDVLKWMPARQRPKGTIKTDFVSGAMSAGDRDTALARLKSSKEDYHLIANARVLTEGIDVPDLDGVAFMDPRNSEVDIVQAVGRAIRKPRGKNKDKIGTIVLPIVIEQGDDAEAELDRTEYKAIWAVLRALRAHDERLAEEIDALRRGLGRTEATRRSEMPKRVILDLPRPAGAAFAHALSTRLIAAATSPWEEWFGRLEAFVAEHGHARPIQRESFGGFRLGAWVSQQRSNRDRLLPNRRERLEALPGWSWDANWGAWEEGFSRLEDFVAEDGHAQPPTDTAVNGYRLGNWVATQRGLRDRLVSARRERLEALPGWSWDPYGEAWEEGFGRLVLYVAENGDARPAQTELLDDFRLGVWVNKQRRNRDHLAADRRKRLEALPGWTWNPLEAKWEEGFNHLEAFVKEHGHARPPTKSHTVDGYRLGGWVTEQRGKIDRLAADRRKRLEALPGWTWNPLEAKWEEGFNHLEAFVKEHGHARPPNGHAVNGYQLGKWVTVQRGLRDRLVSARRERLEALPGWSWDPFGDAWEEGFRHLELYADELGHARPSADVSFKAYPLGAWVSRQRRRRDVLGADKENRLEALPGWTWDARSPKN